MIGDCISFAVGGQSIAAMFRLKGKETFRRRLREVAPGSPTVRIWGHTRGGTFAASTNERPGRSDYGHRHWWNIERDEPSPEFVAGLAAKAAFASHPCECLLWDLGQSEAGSLRGKGGRDPAAAYADFRYATMRILGYWRSVLSPDDPDALPILIMPHAPHPLDGKPLGAGVGRVRDAQYDLIETLANCHNIGIVRDMEMNDPMHPTTAGIQVYAARVADAFARVVLPSFPRKTGAAASARPLQAARP